MLFFDKDFSLLTSSQQTFVAAIATLVVLCSYKSNSNFLSSLTIIFKDVFHKDIQNKIESLKKALDFSFLDECNIYSHSTKVDVDDKERLLKIQLKADVIRNDFFNNATEDKIDKSQVNFDNKTKFNDEKPFPLLMAFFTFVMCVAVLTVDSLNFNHIFSIFILFVFDIVFIVLTMAGWVEYWRDEFPSADKINHKTRLFIIAGLFVLCLLMFRMSLYIKIILLVISILLFANHLYQKIIRRCKDNTYNIRYIAKYEIKWMCFATIIAGVIFIAFQYDFVYIIMPDFIQNIFDNVMDNNLLIINGIFIWRQIFISLCILNAFILPLSLKFLYDRKNWQTIKIPIEKDLKQADNELKELKEQYKKLKEDILRKQGADPS